MFWSKKILLLHRCSCVLVLEKKKKDIKKRRIPLYKTKNVEINGYHLLQGLLSIRKLNSVQGILRGHCQEPLCCESTEFWNSGKQISAGFPTEKLAVSSFSLFSLSRHCRSLSSATSHLILGVIKPRTQVQKILHQELEPWEQSADFNFQTWKS